ncbi:MAG: hypothetical protein AUK47_14450 [Deltaproteobacteria bacterium CG2_30_63_29]|nr:MAG: hypothetical protein AUK47_14450 [Deltaproteobacteria bacterium CG2_30_63_29]PIW00982.1 MAG: hypothetical protein COW42_06290 [Deltaproteobacteria bacterium CG17_big_fil_post_rev_8_21_14_2_50_63_7]PJB48929.1 MAG: hypothetical protein CO108_01370 [Deltaproteobacteria bacterium CG_4_9_14_3_um_filter_63_12]
MADDERADGPDGAASPQQGIAERTTEKEVKVPGRFMRTLKTGGLGGLVSSSYLGGKVLDSFRKGDAKKLAQSERHKKNAVRMLETMSELRGPIMKIGQLLSTHREVLPDSYTGLLTKLQSQAPSMPYESVRQILIDELGAPPETLFQRFDKHACAAASLGQVHQAWLHSGEKVAVKVQYPGAEGMVEGDLKNLDLGMKLVKSIGADVMRNKKFDLTPVYEEIAEHLRQETDLCREAFNAQLLYDLFADHPDIIIPKVYLELSGLRVITYEFIEGENIGAFIDRTDKLDQAEKERVAGMLTDAFWGQLAGQGVLHADPHPGNYFVTPEGKLAILDFGCIKIFSPNTVVGFIELVRAYLEHSDKGVHAALYKLEMVESLDDMDEFDDLNRIGEYFCTGLDVDDTYSFVDNNYAERGRELIHYFISRRRIPKAQKDFIFMTRVILGYFEYFSRMDLDMNFRRIALPHITRGFQGRKVAIPDFYLDND